MLHKCANPDCVIRFRFLGRGRLFQIESDYVEALQRIPERCGMPVQCAG
jgi:hypothetical protein